MSAAPPIAASISEEGELSLNDLAALSLEESTASAAKEDTDAAVIQLLSECFGVNGISGTCIRHVTYPVITGLVQSSDGDAANHTSSNNSSGSLSGGGCKGATATAAHPPKLKIVSCRVCYVEEKSVGIRQYPTFAAVVTQLKTYAGEATSSEFNTSMALFGSVSSFDTANLPSNVHTVNNSNSIETVGNNSMASTGNAIAPTRSTSDGTLGGVMGNQSTEGNLSSRFLAMLQQPGAMESCLKRLNQVQNWMLRAKEKDLLVQQLQLRKLEKRLAEALQYNEELKGTVKQLRRTIQQDLKVIKTMATQQMEDELAASSSHHHDQYGNQLQLQQHEYDDNDASSSPMKSGSPAVKRSGSGTSISPSKITPLTLGGMSSASAGTSRFSPSKRAGVTRNISSVSVSIPEHEEQTDGGDLEGEEEQIVTSNTPDRDIGRTRSNRSLYWNNEALKSTKIFQSFRGGLLDIPKSPPAARHDRDGDGNVNPQRKKLQLNTAAMDALKLPSRALSRSNSHAATTPPPPALLGANISLDAIASKLAMFADDSGDKVAASDSVTTDDSSTLMPMAPPFDMGNGTVESVDGTDVAGTATDDSLSTLTMGTTDLVANVAARHLSEAVEGGATPTIAEHVAQPADDDADGTAMTGSKEFFVTGATCQDKFGDEGSYTGFILVTEGLPHGRGKMEYESGRVYDGDWVSGQWHGKGKLLNPNGDLYDGEFFFDARHGQGVYRWDNGDVYIGNFSSDKRHGKGKFSFHNGNVYQGEFCDGMFEGFGRYDFEGGYYEGDWKEGRYDGSGELLYATGGKYTGEFRNSVAHGFGMEVLPDGTKRRGIWVDGKPTE